MKFSILVIMLLVLTLLVIGGYNYYELHHQPDSLPEPALNIKNEEKNLNNPLTPEDLPPDLSVSRKLPREEYSIVSQVDGEKGTLTIDSDLTGDGFIQIVNPQTDLTETLEFNVKAGVVGSSTMLNEGAKLMPGNGVHCVVAVSTSHLNFSRCFALSEKVSNLLDHYEDEQRNRNEQDYMNVADVTHLNYQDEQFQEAPQEEQLFNEVSYNFDESQ